MVVCFAGVSFHKRDRFKVRGVLTFHVAAFILLHDYFMYDYFISTLSQRKSLKIYLN